MLKFIALFALVAGAFASPIPGDGRVVNGTDAKPGEIPYIVSLRSSNSHICGGSILDEQHILTAAHCVESGRPDYLSIQYGVTKITSDNIQAIKVTKVNVHEDYDTWQIINDIAVLTLASSLSYNENVQPITLPAQGEAPPAGGTSILAGWGYPYSGGGVMKDLQRVDLIVYSDEDCKKAHGSNVDAKYNVCSGVPEGGKGQCSGDSGGPLYAGGKQIGAVSWSVKPCTVKGYPGVYTRVSSYIDWINEKVQL